LEVKRIGKGGNIVSPMDGMANKNKQTQITA
jgi:hypothetical protein